MIKALSSSLSLRLLCIFGITAIALIVILVASFSKGMSGQWRRSIQPHLVQYIQYVQQDLGSPPKPERAEVLSERLLVDIYIYQADEFIYSTNASALDLNQTSFYPVTHRFPTEYQNLTKSLGIEASMTREGGPYERILRIDQNGYSVFYDLQKRFSRPRQLRFIRSELVHALIGFMLVFVASYFAIRQLLKPIRQIQQGVGHMSNAHLNHRIDRLGSGDLDVLAQSIDSMAERLSALLDAKRQLLMALSHELRSPITRARISSELLPSSKNRDRLLDDLENMERIINDIMESEKLQSGHTLLNKDSVDLPALINDELQRQVPGVVLALIDDISIHPIQADAARLRIVFRNVLLNAVQHGSGNDGHVDLHAQLRGTADGLEIIIRDHGKGIDPEHLRFISDPFYRPDSSRSRETGGFGMGLTLAKLIVESHKGHIDIISYPSITPGTQVCIFLPSN